ncbi:MAG: tetratricopeptide repeat protein [Alistipes sp.]
MVMRKGLIFLIFLLLSAYQSTFAVDDHAQTQTTLQRGRELMTRGRWIDARNELKRVRAELTTADRYDLQRVDYYLTLCTANLNSSQAEASLQAFEETYPSSIYTNDIRLALALHYCTLSAYDQARTAFSKVNYKALNNPDREKYNIRQGYLAFLQKDYPAASLYLNRIDPKSEYADHALYYNSYIAYDQDYYPLAQSGFNELLKSDTYKDLAPFYLLQIEFKQKNYPHITQTGDALIRTAAPERRSELLRMMAESWFHQNDYQRTLSYMNDYHKAGGEIGREEAYLEGYSLYRSARYKEATKLLRQACGADDALTQNAAYHLADCYLRQGNKQLAMQAFAMSANGATDPKLVENALFNYGKLQYELGGGHFNEAIHILSRYITQYPSSSHTAEARTLLAAAYYNSNDYEAAYQALSKLPNPDGEMRAALQKITYFRGLHYYEQGDLERATADLAASATINVSPKYTSLAAFWQGEIAYAKGDYDTAKQHYEAYLQRAPRNEREYAMAHYNLGYCSFAQQNMATAGEQFTQFLSRYPTIDSYRADALNRCGDTEYAARQFSAAVKSYDRAIATGQKEKYYAQYKRAVTFGILDHPSQKIEALKQIIHADKGEYVMEATYELGRTYLAQEQYKNGADLLERFISTYPQSAHYTAALSDLGLVHMNLGNKEKSLAYYDKVVKTAPNSPASKEALQSIREIYVGEGDAATYFTYAEGVGAESDLSAMARDSISFLAAQKLYLADKTEAASRSLRSYLKSFPKGYYLSDALYYLSDCYLRTDQQDQAIETLTQLSEQGQNQYTTSTWEKLAPLTAAKGRYAEAATAYRKLYAAVPATTAKDEALINYIQSTLATKNDDAILAMADDVAAQPEVGEIALRKSRFAKANILYQRGESDAALKLFQPLSREVRSAEGAESMYRVIEATHAAGDDKRAEQLIIAFSEKKSSHTYWLAKSFILLGDIYLARKDNFQARATFQSVVDGYSPATDGIVAEAKARIDKMKN